MDDTEITVVKRMPALEEGAHIACYPDPLIQLLEKKFPEFDLRSVRFHIYHLVVLDKLHVEFVSSEGDTFECQLNLGNRPHRNDVVFKCMVNQRESKYFTPFMQDVSYAIYQYMMEFMRQKSSIRLAFITGTNYYQLPHFIKEFALERNESWEF